MRIVTLCMILALIAPQFAGAQTDRNVFLIARNTGKKGLASGDTVRVFGFVENLSTQPNVPGPTIYANQGDSVHIDVWNVSQGAGHTIHLHGLDVDQQNDGVPHLSFEIAHMEHGFYHFKAPHAGTYLYHCHVASSIHVQAGMYGLLIVRPTDGGKTTWDNGFPFEREQSFLCSEIDTKWHKDSVLNHPHGPGHGPIRIPAYNPDFFLVNGLSDGQLKEYDVRIVNKVNTNTYLRFANIGFYANQIVIPEALEARIVDSDGRPLPTVVRSDTLMVFPGERYGVLIHGTMTGQDSLRINYLDLNTLSVHNTQWVPIQVQATLTSPNMQIHSLSVQPNPMQDLLYIELPVEVRGNVVVRMINSHGAVVEEQVHQVFETQDPWIRTQWETGVGIYVVEMIDARGQLWRSRVVVVD